MAQFSRFILRCFGLFPVLGGQLVNSQTTGSKAFYLVTMTTPDPFYELLIEGCVETAKQLGAECNVKSPETMDATVQAALIDTLIEEGEASGFLIASLDPNITGAAIDRATAAGIPVVTVDSDAPDSTRTSYIGSDNNHLGDSMAWLLAVGNPDGGTYGTISDSATSVNNRVEGLNSQLSESYANIDWESFGDATDCEDDTQVALDQLATFAADPDIKAVVSVGGWPMYNITGFKAVVDSRPDMIYIVGDTLPVQTELFNEGYVDGLVGQRPKDMGSIGVTTLNSIVEGKSVDEIIHTGEEVFFQTRNYNQESTGVTAATLTANVLTLVCFVASLFSTLLG